MYKIATITFHHAYNFGSMLQAYALQTCVENIAKEENIDIEYKIIDFYSDIQQNLYRIFKQFRSPKNIIKNFIALLNYRSLKERNRKFEDFLNSECRLTRRYHSEEELRRDYPRADCYISGSDQLWNVRATDFSPVYYYDFLPKTARRISYAASFGPLEINWDLYKGGSYSELLAQYDAVSVRELGSVDTLQSISDKECEVHVDPTFLLTSEQWREIESDANYNEGNYILLYCLEPSKEQLEIAEAISKKMKLPIVVLRYNNKNDMFNRFVKKYATGPRDFLAYIDHAALVLSSSFHGTAFSLIYNKPFYCLRTSQDKRIMSILEKVGEENRVLNTLSDVENINMLPRDNVKIEKVLESERKRSKEYLKCNLQMI